MTVDLPTPTIATPPTSGITPPKRWVPGLWHRDPSRRRMNYDDAVKVARLLDLYPQAVNELLWWV